MVKAYRVERLRRDIAAYRRTPPTAAEKALGLLADSGGLDDETDWEALYFEVEGNHQSKQRS